MANSYSLYSMRRSIVQFRAPGQLIKDYNQLYMGQHCNANIFIARKISILKFNHISIFAFFVCIRLNQHSLVCDKTIIDKKLRN